MMSKKRKRKLERNTNQIQMIMPAVISTIVLHDIYGWGSKKRLPDFSSHVLEMLSQIEAGELDPVLLITRWEELTGSKVEI